MTTQPTSIETAFLHATQQWLDAAVISLNLCPYAKAVRTRGQIRFVVSPACGKDALQQDLRTELLHLVQADAQVLDTTLLIHPQALQDFEAYNRFLRVADALLTQLGLQGVIQIASFHPQYRFAGTRAHDPENCTNRSPYPMLHLLREASVDRALGGEASTPRLKQENARVIAARNVRVLRELGLAGYRRLLASSQGSAD
jgi:uncharacterized protein